MEISKKAWKKKKKKYLRERQNKKKDSDSTPAIEVNIINLNFTSKGRRKNLS